MNKPPAFQFYVKDWRSSSQVRSMTREQRGDFIDMLATSWDQDEPGTLPLPIELTAKICGISARSCRKFVETFPKLWQIEGDRLVNPKLRAQWEELRQLKQKQSDGARKTNKEYWKRPSGTDSVTDRSASSSASDTSSASAKSKSSCPPPADNANDSASQSSPPQPSISIPAKEIAVLLRQRVLENNPKAKITEKQVCEWGREADFMLCLDHRTAEEISTLIDWSQRDSFWKTNILSMKTLRKHFDRLTAKMLANAESDQPAWKKQEQVEEQEGRESWRLISQLAKEVRG